MEPRRWPHLPGARVNDWPGFQCELQRSWHQDLQYVKHTLLPWCRRIEDEITAKLLREGEGQVVAL